MKARDRPADPARRIAEGWGFCDDPGKEEISTFGGRFRTDADAVAFVTRRAAEGSEYHAECLAYALAQRMIG